METVVYSLIVAAITGLTAIAYTQPDFYRENFDNKVFAIAVGSLVLVNSWGLAVSMTFKTLKEFIVEDKLEAANKAVEAISVSMDVQIGIWVAIVYCFFLNWLASTRYWHERKKTSNK